MSHRRKAKDQRKLSRLPVSYVPLPGTGHLDHGPTCPHCNTYAWIAITEDDLFMDISEACEACDEIVWPHRYWPGISMFDYRCSCGMEWSVRIDDPNLFEDGVRFGTE